MIWTDEPLEPGEHIDIEHTYGGIVLRDEGDGMYVVVTLIRDSMLNKPHERFDAEMDELLHRTMRDYLAQRDADAPIPHDGENVT